MRNPVDPKQIQGCERKRKFTKNQARTHAARSRKDSGDSRIRHYRCSYCGGWHVGHDRRAS